MSPMAFLALALPYPFDRDYMQLALFAGLAVGLSAPLLGTFLVERRMSLLGDGIGHIAFAGVSAGLVAGIWPIWTALIAAVIGAVGLELMRSAGRTGGDLALAVVFYGGIAGGIVLAGAGGNYNASVLSYLFGSILTVDRSEVVTVTVVGLILVIVVTVFWRVMLATVTDADFARTLGIPVRIIDLGIAVGAALVIVGAMRVVGLLLVAALMVLPVGAVRVVAPSFRATMFGSSALGGVSVIVGLWIARVNALPPGGTIVLVVVAAVIVSGLARAANSWVRARKQTATH
jgi:zinc transport system permease protein